jgi:hypothetical protein
MDFPSIGTTWPAHIGFKGEIGGDGHLGGISPAVIIPRSFP